MIRIGRTALHPYNSEQDLTSKRSVLFKLDFPRYGTFMGYTYQYTILEYLSWITGILSDSKNSNIACYGPIINALCTQSNAYVTIIDKYPKQKHSLQALKDKYGLIEELKCWFPYGLNVIQFPEYSLFMADEYAPAQNIVDGLGPEYYYRYNLKKNARPVIEYIGLNEEKIEGNAGLWARISVNMAPVMQTLVEGPFLDRPLMPITDIEETWRRPPVTKRFIPLTVWPSVNAAYAYTSNPPGAIARVAMGHAKICGGHIWRYATSCIYDPQPLPVYMDRQYGKNVWRSSDFVFPDTPAIPSPVSSPTPASAPPGLEDLW